MIQSTATHVAPVSNSTYPISLLLHDCTHIECTVLCHMGRIPWGNVRVFSWGQDLKIELLLTFLAQFSPKRESSTFWNPGDKALTITLGTIEMVDVFTEMCLHLPMPCRQSISTVFRISRLENKMIDRLLKK